MRSLFWYRNRLARMSPAEVLYRVAHKLAEQRDRKRFRKQPPSCPYGAETVLSPRLFGLQPLDRQGLRAHLERCGGKLIAMADAALANRIDVFGIVHDFGDTIDYHLDVKTGRRWPLRFWAEVNIRDGFTVGGPKFVWETNRLYGLVPLGLAWRLTGEERYSGKIFSTLAEWLAANPYPHGVNWTSGIELGIRVANLLWAVSALEGRGIADEETELVNRFVWLHGRHLFRYPSKYSSNNNHAIAEAFALFLIGVHFPGFVEAEKWLAFGRQVLDREGQRQILADGGSYEYTTTYLSFVFDFFLLYKLVCERNELPCAPGIDARLQRSCELIHALMDANGHVPNIGDQDSAVLVNFGMDNLTNFESILNTGSALYRRPEFRRPSFPDMKTLLLLGDRAVVDPVTEVDASRGEARSRLFKESGLAVIRDEFAGREIVFTGNATPLGMPPLHAHGHLDALAVTLSAAGLEILVDPGTYLYHSGGVWRRYFRSTAAHNTIRINGADLTDQVADFMFGKPYRITEHSLREEADRIVWQAGHDAYLRLAAPVSCMRLAVVERGRGRVRMIDRLAGRGGYLVEQHFHFHPECSLELAGNRAVVRREGIRVAMEFDPRLTIAAFRGSREPLLGWYSPSFNRLQSCWSLVGRVEANGILELKTALGIEVPAAGKG
ncbi:MAG: alginate lyase family protein [Thermodesulfobacteriota bacterium]